MKASLFSNALATVIFDMDGLLIDSEPFWTQAEQTVFSALGVNVTANNAMQTASMTTEKVTQFWFQQSPWTGKSLKAVEQAVIDEVNGLINKHGCAKEGVLPLLELLTQHDITIGLASNAPTSTIQTVLDRLNISHYFKATTSSDEVKAGKPNPAVYLKTLNKLKTQAQQTIAIEDSVAGMTAAKKAGIQCIVVPEAQNYHNPEFTSAALKVDRLSLLDYQLLSNLIT